jgi:hypothetical protein
VPTAIVSVVDVKLARLAIGALEAVRAAVLTRSLAHFRAAADRLSQG